MAMVLNVYCYSFIIHHPYDGGNLAGTQTINERRCKVVATLLLYSWYFWVGVIWLAGIPVIGIPLSRHILPFASVLERTPYDNARCSVLRIFLVLLWPLVVASVIISFLRS